jgi:acyl-CoA synthetase (AMP-forming)/AMP-acid ligase II
VTLGADLSGIFDTVTGRATLGDQLRRHARNQPDRLAIAHYDKAGTCLDRVTYRELNQRVNRLARSLRDLGIGHGDVVAIMSPNSLDYGVMYVAAAKLGAITTGINCNFHDAEIQFQIQHSEPVAIMVETSFAARVDDKRAALSSIRHFISSGPAEGASPSTPGAEWVPVSSLYADSVDDSEPNSDVTERDPLFMIYTSGTEAFPKAVLIPHRNYSIATLPGWAVGAPSQDDVLTGGIIQSHDRWLHLTPLHTIAGLGNLTITLSTGASVIMPTTPDPKLCLALIERERVTAAVQTPTFFLAAVKIPEFARADLSSIERVLTYGATMPQSMIDGWNSKSAKLKWGTYWGQSELTQLGTTGWFRTLDDIPGRDVSWVGRPVSTLELILVDENGDEVGVDEAGEAWCRSPGVMLGYYKDPERTAETFQGGWLHTGDIMRRDANGNLFFLDRRKDMIKTGGYNVSSQEVEKLLYRHPDVAQVAVVGLPHDYWSEAVTAFVVLHAGADVTDEALMAFCKAEAVNYKVPKAVQFMDALPVDGQGKVLKRELRRLNTNLYDD